MTFHIISTGWQCADWIEQTLKSIEKQSVEDWRAWIVYDPSEDDGALRLTDFLLARPLDGRWHVQINTDRRFAVRNQYEAIRRADPVDDDIIVFLDLDGDRFAHADVLLELKAAYATGMLLTYGSYKPVPPAAGCAPAVPFPRDVVRTNGYRRHILSGKGCCFNHLRTMSGRIANAIPDDHFRWAKGPKRGQWYEAGTDYIFMVAGLELAGGRYKCIDEVLCLYNNANPNADYLHHPAEANACTQDYLRRPPLAPLGAKPMTRPASPPRTPGKSREPFLPPLERRKILRSYGEQHGLKVFIETGTANGDTPAALMRYFEQLHTIEVGEDQYKAAVRRFRDSNVRCYHGDSGQILPEILTEIGDQRALLWLDGHYCGGDRADKDTPILEELEAIFSTGVDHVILIDDARLFEGMTHYGEHDWPHIDQIRDLAESHGYSYECADDIIRLTPGADGA